MKVLSVFLVSCLAFVGCSTAKKQHKDVVKEVVAKEVIQSEQEQMNVIASIEKRLDQITDDAILSGEESVDYLASDLFFKANDASLQGDPYTASIIYKYLVKLKPEDLYLRKKLAVELVKTNQLVGAQKHLDKLVKEADAELSTKAKLLLAGVYSALSYSDKAIKLYKEIIDEKKGEIVEACAFLSKAYAEDKKYKRAFSVLNYCQKESKEKAVFSFYKAKIEFDRERNRSAQRYLVKALKQDPEHYQSVLLLGHIYEGKSQHARAEKLYEKFLRKNPNQYSVLNKYVTLLFSEEKYEKVIPYLEKLVSIDEDNLNLRVRLGVLYTEVNRVDEAIVIFEQILKQVPDSDKVLYYLGSLHQQAGDIEHSIKYFSKINSDSALFYESNIQIAQILNHLAVKNIQEGRTDGRDRFFSFVRSKSLVSEALKVELNVILASYFESNKEFGEAISTLEKIRNLKEFADGHDYYLAALYEKVKNHKEAELIISKMLEKNPENPHALNFIGYSLIERGENMDVAYKYIKKAVSLKPNDGYIRDSLGWYYYKTGQYEKAYEETKKAFSLVQDDVSITKHLALIYKAMKKYDKAKEYYVEALKNCEAVSEREEVIRELESLDSLRLPASQ